MSDIGILSDPVSLMLIALIFGSPGLLLGIPGALLWKKHRFAGAMLGAAGGFILCLAGWMIAKDII